MQRNSIIHRDLKPANILVHEGLFKIADFGFSKQLPDSAFIGPGTQGGSRPTMAPEITKGQHYGLKVRVG